MKLIISGGHLTPALSVIQKLPKNNEVIYIGRKLALEGDSALSLEYQTISKKKDIRFIVFQPGRLQRKFTKHTLGSIVRVPKGIFEAIKILLKEKPDIILSFGGYVSFPICLAGLILRIPIVLHEQTLEIGAANKIISRFADKICVSWKSSLKYFPKDKTILTGNPILESNPSKEIKDLFENSSKKYPIVTITGGSLGSHAINSLVEPILERLLGKFTVLHQTGNAQEFKDFDKFEEIKKSLPEVLKNRYILKKFIEPDDIYYVYSHSDFVVSRSGINTTLTLLLSNTPCILIPLPVSHRQEQLKNAEMVNKLGLGEIFFQDNESSENLLNKIEYIGKNISKYKNKNIKEIRELHKNAAEKIANVINMVYDAKIKLLQKKA